jgi:hypothetical protein|tara:strand:+ start:24 stop:383 length:360 start_codon:yes stop_codon:yes gene_type:complete
MALNSVMHEAYLDLPLDVQMMPELEGLPYWSAVTHQLLLEVDPTKLKELNEANRLKSYLAEMQEKLSELQAETIAKWKAANPKKEGASYLEAASWENHAKLAARELIRNDLADFLGITH